MTADAGAPLVLATGGTLVVPKVVLRADEYEGFTPDANLVSGLVPAFATAAATDGLARTGRSDFRRDDQRGDGCVASPGCAARERPVGR